MDLQHIDVRAQAVDAGIHRIEDVLPREADAVDEAAVVGARGRDRGHTAFVVNAEVAFGQDDDAGARDRVFLQSFAENLFRAAVGVDVGLYGVIILISITHIHMVEVDTVSQVLIPLLYACSINGSASSSSNTQSCHCFEPYDMAPRMTLETLRPELPSLVPS